MRTLLLRKYLFLVPIRDSARTLECWQFTDVDPIERPRDAPDCLTRTTEQRRLARLQCVKSRPHDLSIESLFNCEKMVIQVAFAGSSILTPRTKAYYDHSNARYNMFNEPANGPE
jgi:hypothetical protein